MNNPSRVILMGFLFCHKVAKAQSHCEEERRSNLTIYSQINYFISYFLEIDISIDLQPINSN